MAIFGPTDPARNGPFGGRCLVLRNPGSRTNHARRAKADEGLLEIGLVLTSLYFIARRNIFPTLGTIAGVLGAVLAIYGYFA